MPQLRRRVHSPTSTGYGSPSVSPMLPARVCVIHNARTHRSTHAHCHMRIADVALRLPGSVPEFSSMKTKSKQRRCAFRRKFFRAINHASLSCAGGMLVMLDPYIREGTQAVLTSLATLTPARRRRFFGGTRYAAILLVWTPPSSEKLPAPKAHFFECPGFDTVVTLWHADLPTKGKRNYFDMFRSTNRGGMNQHEVRTRREKRGSGGGLRGRDALR